MLLLYIDEPGQWLSCCRRFSRLLASDYLGRLIIMIETILISTSISLFNVIIISSRIIHTPLLFTSTASLSVWLLVVTEQLFGLMVSSCSQPFLLMLEHIFQRERDIQARMFRKSPISISLHKQSITSLLHLLLHRPYISLLLLLLHRPTTISDSVRTHPDLNPALSLPFSRFAVRWFLCRCPGGLFRRLRGRLGSFLCGWLLL